MQVELIDHMGNDMSVVNAARVSFANENDETRTEVQNGKLIKYLANNGHWTPFAHTQITVRVRAPIPIRTQCFKHKFGFVENEESRRYVSYTPTYYVPDFRKACDNKKQGSGDLFSEHDQVLLKKYYEESIEDAIGRYETLLADGVCEEQARFVLPQGCEVNWYWTGSLVAFARFFNQRTDDHAQKEIQDLAHMVGDLIEPLYPIAWRELTKSD